MAENVNEKTATKELSSSNVDMTDESVDKIKIRVGSRASHLAKVQAELVIQELKNHYGEEKFEFELITMTTLGDRILNSPLSKVGEKSLFTKDLEEALLSNKIDCIVHSLKDLPTSLPSGCCISAILE